MGNHFLSEAVAEVVLAGVAGEILEGQDRQHPFSAGRVGSHPKMGPPDIRKQGCNQYDGGRGKERPAPVRGLSMLRFTGSNLGLRESMRCSHGRIEDRRDETIALASDGLYEARLFGIIPQDLADLADGAIDAVVGVKRDPGAPNALNDLLAGNDFVPLLDKEEQKLHGDALQFEHTTAAAHLVRTLVELKILAKPDCLLDKKWHRRHRRPTNRVAELYIGLTQVASSGLCFLPLSGT